MGFTISFIIDSFSTGGKERQLFYLIKSLAFKHKLQIIILSKNALCDEIFDLPIKVCIYERTNRYSIKTIISLYQNLNKHKPQIIHSWANIGTILSLPYLIVHHKVKLVSSIRYAGKLKRTLKDKIIKTITWFRSAAIVSNSIRGLEVENLLNHKKSTVIHNGLDLEIFDSDYKNTHAIFCPLDKFKLKIVMVGRFYLAKDYITFIKAAKIVSNSTKEICFVCVGDGPYKTEAEIEADNLLNNTIFFLGNRNDVNSLIKAMDIGILLNNINGHAEGISNAIMEYMAAGLPVIATNAGGTPELVQHHISGFLVPAFDEDIVAKKILYLLKNNDKATEMGVNGRQIIENKFDLNKMTESYLELYLNICKLKR